MALVLFTTPTLVLGQDDMYSMDVFLANRAWIELDGGGRGTFTNMTFNITWGVLDEVGGDHAIDVGITADLPGVEPDQPVDYIVIDVSADDLVVDSYEFGFSLLTLETVDSFDKHYLQVTPTSPLLGGSFNDPSSRLNLEYVFNLSPGLSVAQLQAIEAVAGIILTMGFLATGMISVAISNYMHPPNAKQREAARRAWMGPGPYIIILAIGFWIVQYSPSQVEPSERVLPWERESLFFLTADSAPTTNAASWVATGIMIIYANRNASKSATLAALQIWTLGQILTLVALIPDATGRIALFSPAFIFICCGCSPCALAIYSIQIMQFQKLSRAGSNERRESVDFAKTPVTTVAEELIPSNPSV